MLLTLLGNVEINSSNPGTDTIQGPNVVMYDEALYYNCYNRAAVCRFNLTSKSVTSVQLPAGTRWVVPLDRAFNKTLELHLSSLHFLKIQLQRRLLQS